MKSVSDRDTFRSLICEMTESAVFLAAYAKFYLNCIADDGSTLIYIGTGYKWTSACGSSVVRGDVLKRRQIAGLSGEGVLVEGHEVTYLQIAKVYELNHLVEI